MKDSSIRDTGEGYKTPHRGQAFWDYRPFSRLLFWGKDYTTAINYLLKNTLEALGFLTYEPRAKNYVYENMQRRKINDGPAMNRARGSKR